MPGQAKISQSDKQQLDQSPVKVDTSALAVIGKGKQVQALTATESAELAQELLHDYFEELGSWVEEQLFPGHFWTKTAGKKKAKTISKDLSGTLDKYQYKGPTVELGDQYSRLVHLARTSEKGKKKTTDRIAKLLRIKALRRAAEMTLAWELGRCHLAAQYGIGDAAVNGRDAAIKKKRHLFSKHKTFLKNAIGKQAKSDALVNLDKALDDKDVQQEAVKASLTGQATSALSKLGELIDKRLTPESAGTLGVEVELRIPVHPNVSLTIVFNGVAEREEGQTTVSAELGLQVAGEFDLKIMKVSAFAGLGGYLEASAESAAGAMKLVSFALYKRFRASSVVHHSITDYIWGLGGRSGLSPKQEADAWAEAIWDEYLNGKEDNFVETGFYAQVGGKLQAENLLSSEELKAVLEARVKRGTKHQGTEQGSETQSTKTKQIHASFAHDNFEADLTYSVGKEKKLEYEFTGLIPVGYWGSIAAIIKGTADKSARMTQKMCKSESEDDVLSDNQVLVEYADVMCNGLKQAVAAGMNPDTDLAITIEGEVVFNGKGVKNNYDVALKVGLVQDVVDFKLLGSKVEITASTLLFRIGKGYEDGVWSKSWRVLDMSTDSTIGSEGTRL